MKRLYLPISLYPYLPISLSPYLPISLSPYLPISLYPYIPKQEVLQYYHGVLVAQGSKPHDLILSAHIDRQGLLCTGTNEFQYAAFY